MKWVGEIGDKEILAEGEEERKLEGRQGGLKNRSGFPLQEAGAEWTRLYLRGAVVSTHSGRGDGLD